MDSGCVYATIYTGVHIRWPEAIEYDICSVTGCSGTMFFCWTRNNLHPLKSLTMAKRSLFSMCIQAAGHPSWNDRNNGFLVLMSTPMFQPRVANSKDIEMQDHVRT